MGATFAIIAGVIGTAVSAVGAMSQAAAASENASYQAQVAANNAKIAKQNAAWTMEAGEQKAANDAMKTRAMVGQIKASEAANGVDVNTGSAVDVVSSETGLGQAQQTTIRSNAAKDAYGYDVQSMNFTAQSQLDRQEADQAMTAGMFNVAGSLIGGASSTNSDWMKYKAAGLA